MNKKNELKTIRSLDTKSLIESVANAKRSMFKLKFNRFTSGIEKPHLLKKLRVEIARSLQELQARKK